jgi:hypothetical protein
MWYRDIGHLRETEEYVSLSDLIQTIIGSANSCKEWARLQSYYPGLCARIPLAYVPFAGPGERMTPCTNAA